MKSQVLASQLRCPSGAEASEVARKMNDANRSLNQKCIDLLQIKASDAVLEIGPGNGAFASEIISKAEGVSYLGLDWSGEMVAEATRLNQLAVQTGQVVFQQGSSELSALHLKPAHLIRLWQCTHSTFGSSPRNTSRRFDAS